MGWRFRKTVKFGPLNVNLSKSGVGWSVGGRGFRVGRSATGKEYSQLSVPGTGLYRRDQYQNAHDRWAEIVFVVALLAMLLWFFGGR